MTIEDGRLHLRSPSTPMRENRPIDIFFTSLAADRGCSAVGVVLSGTGSDGALGLKSIKQAGGVSLAQGGDGSRPQYDGMPSAAIATGAVDLILPSRQCRSASCICQCDRWRMHRRPHSREFVDRRGGAGDLPDPAQPDRP